MKKDERTQRMFLEDMQMAMKRIAEYIEGYDYKNF
jgi:uncharacterized protein with HEPN domain